jgi:hypothetical protein
MTWRAALPRHLQVFPHPFLHDEREAGQPVTHLLVLYRHHLQLVLTEHVDGGQFTGLCLGIVIRREQGQVEVGIAERDFIAVQLLPGTSPFLCGLFGAGEQCGVG